MNDFKTISTDKVTRAPRTPIFKGNLCDEKDCQVEAVVDRIGIILDHALRDIRKSKKLSNGELAEKLKYAVDDALTVSRICSDTNSDERHVNLQILVNAYYAGLIDINATLDKALEDAANPDIRQQWDDIDAKYRQSRECRNEQRKKRKAESKLPNPAFPQHR